MRQGVAEALRELRPGAKWICDGNVYSGITWLEGDGGQTIPTQAQVDSKVAELNAAESMRLLRVERDKRLTACDWVVTKATETGGTVSDDWKTYRQALRDLPSSASPKLNSIYNLDLTSVTWPTEP